MKITCTDKEIKKVLENGYYSIPRFQRPYSWEKEHIAEFWNDSVLENEADYFIGSIVVFKKKTGDLFGIVDGQQRLTTITMILCSIRDFYLQENSEPLALGVHSLIEKIDLNNDKQYILQTETSYPYFQEHVQKYFDPEVEVALGQEEMNLKQGFDQINKYISEEILKIRRNNQNTSEQIKLFIVDKLNEIRDKVLKLKVIYIELDDEEDAYLIFETLNTRGKDLDVSDLVKNYLTKNIKQDNKAVDLVKDKWGVIKDNIDSSSRDINIETFLLHFWLSKYEYTTLKTLFKKLKKEIKSKQARSFLDDLVSNSLIYKNIFDTDSRKWNKNELSIKDSLAALYAFNVTQQAPMALSVMREYDAGNLKFRHVRDILESIEHFHYIFTAVTSQRSSGSIASMYSIYARKLSAAADEAEKVKILQDLTQKMREKVPTYDEFLASFRTLKFTQEYTKDKKIIQYTLRKFDKHYNKNGASINYDLMTIEHIFPENPLSRKMPYNENVGRLGNLIFIDAQTNSNELGNKAFNEKKMILQKSSVYIDDTINNATTWTEHEVNLRTELMAQKLFNEVFKI